jgi:phosphate transport system protein
MSHHLQKAIAQLKTSLLQVGTRVEESLREAVTALNQRDREKAQVVIDNDDAIDQLEVEVEEECLKILALHQPVASDLRFIVASLKINNDLERVGDLAVNISERTLYVAQHAPVDVVLDFQAMATKAQWMLKNSLDALVQLDIDLAREVCLADDEVDDMNREMYVQVQDAIKRNPEKIELLIHLLSTSRHLERIADLATNIAEDVIYMIDGEIVRHRTESYKSE